MIAATLEQVRKAQPKLADLLHDVAEIHGIGIAKLGDGYALRVNLAIETTATTIPPEIDGVPIIVEIVGPIKPL